MRRSWLGRPLDEPRGGDGVNERTDADVHDPIADDLLETDLLGDPDWSSSETLSSEDGVRLYFRDVGWIRLLSAEEEIELARLLEAGSAAADRLRRGDAGPDEEARLRQMVQAGEAARRRLIESNLRLVVSIARKYVGRELPLLDLIQEGNIGLQRAVEKFDWRRGYRFSTYAYWWIRQAIGRALLEHGRAVRLPAHAGEVLVRVARAVQDLYRDLERKPTVEEIAAHLGISSEKVRAVLSVTEPPVSLEASIGGEGSATVADLLLDPASAALHEEAEGRMLSEDLARVLRERLTPEEVLMVRLRFGLDGQGERSLAEIGEAMGVSREWARQLEARIIRKLRASPSLRQLYSEYTGAPPGGTARGGGGRGDADEHEVSKTEGGARAHRAAVA